MRYILCFIVISATFACKSKVNPEMEQIVREWMDKTVIFPDNVKRVYPIEMDSVERIAIDDSAKRYKILVYTDSAGCTSCKLHLRIWKMYMEELYSKVNFLFYFQTKSEEELMQLLEYEQFKYPVYIDNNDDLNRLNHFLDNPAFQCFLLDSDNKILAIGNPVNNSNIWELYKKIINGEIPDRLPVTAVEFEPREIELKNLQVGKTSETVFTLKNVGTHPLTIQMVDASCGCTVPEWEKRPIKSGKTTEIKVQITPEEEGFFNKTITVRCNTKESQILLKINGTVKK
jgi:hypothetical protein